MCAGHWSYNGEQGLVSVLEERPLSGAGRHGHSHDQSGS